MKPVPHPTLLVTLFAATLACSGCILPVEGTAGSAFSSTDSERATPHRCRSSASQSTQKGCRAMEAVARNERAGLRTPGLARQPRS